jgi:hypothetical protein
MVREKALVADPYEFGWNFYFDADPDPTGNCSPKDVKEKKNKERPGKRPSPLKCLGLLPIFNIFSQI